MAIEQKMSQDVRIGDIIWDQFAQDWSTVVVTEHHTVDVKMWLADGRGCLIVERGHMVFFNGDISQPREEWYVSMDELGDAVGLCGPFMSEEAAQEYITNLEDTIPYSYEASDVTYRPVRLVTPEQMLIDSVGREEG